MLIELDVDERQALCDALETAKGAMEQDALAWEEKGFASAGRNREVCRRIETRFRQKAEEYQRLLDKLDRAARP